MFEFDFLSLLCNIPTEYFDDAWYKCRTGRDDVLRTSMTTLVGLGGTFVFFCFFLKKTFLVFFVFFFRIGKIPFFS